MCSCNNKYNNNKYNDNKYSDYDSRYNDNIFTVKQISFQVNWVNTQAFLFNMVLAFSMGITLFDIQTIFSNWVFPQNK